MPGFCQGSGVGGELVDFSAESLQRKNMPSKPCNVVGMFMLKLLSALE